jgi:hypothetical protein
MKLHKLVIFILIVFFKTETLFSENNLFNVNNIQLKKKDKTSNNSLADEAIQRGFDQLITRILLKEDKDKLSDLNFSLIKQLVIYYQITNVHNNDNKEEEVNFSITFDKDKIHSLLYKRGISYSDISDKELYVLPVLIKENQINIFNNNFFYENWNEIYKNDLIEFVLPLENIEIIQNINNYKNNLINLELDSLFNEYKNKNLALIFIEENTSSNKNVYIKSYIQGKNISKSLKFKKENLNTDKFYVKVITESKEELINLIKSQNLINIRTPSFLNANLNLSRKSNLVELNSRIKKIDVIENIYVQNFNKNYVNLRIKYLGKLEKIINLLKTENIDLQLINDQWIIKVL